MQKKKIIVFGFLGRDRCNTYIDESSFTPPMPIPLFDKSCTELMAKIFYLSFVYDQLKTQELLHPIKEPGLWQCAQHQWQSKQTDTLTQNCRQSTQRWKSQRIKSIGQALDFPVLRIRIQDPVPFDPWIRDRFIPGPGSQTLIFESLVTIFWVN